jgi:hypothetical protein
VPPTTDPNPTPCNATSNNEPAADAAITSHFTIDSQLGAVIYQVVNTRTQQVVQQVPDQALLRSIAYSKAIQNGATPFEAQVQAADLYV